MTCGVKTKDMNVGSKKSQKTGEHARDFLIEKVTDSEIQELLLDVSNENGEIGGYIHINEIAAENKSIEEYFCDTEQMLIRSVFFIVKHLKLPLMEQHKNGGGLVSIATRIDGKLGMNGIMPRSIIQGGYFGLVKSLKMEAPQLCCRCVDISPELDDDLTTDIVLDEIFDDKCEHVEVGRCSAKQRITIIKKGNSESLDELSLIQI